MSEDWVSVRLDEICEIRPPKREAKDELKSSDLVSFVPMRDLPIGQKYLMPKQEKPLGKVYGGYTYFANGDVLLAKITPCFQNGKLAIASDLSNGIGFGSSEYIVFRSSKKLINEYLYYYLSRPSFLDEGVSRMSGAVGHQRVPKEFIEDYLIPLPPLADQKRIVSILDDAFAAIDKAKENAKRNLANSQELFESYLCHIFSQKGEGWEEKKLEDIATTFGRGKSRHRPRNDKSLYGGKYPFIQTGEIRNADHFVTTFSKTYNEKGLAQSKLWPIGTLCITIAANIAETAILSFDACIPDSVIGLVCDPSKADVDFVEYLLQFFKSGLQAEGKGAAQDNINMGTFERMSFPFPSVAEQKRIVAEIIRLADQTDRLGVVYHQKISNLEELKQSILQKAFAGQLTSEPAELELVG